MSGYTHANVCRGQRTTYGVGSTFAWVLGLKLSPSPVCYYYYFIVSYLILCVFVVCLNVCLCEGVGSPRDRVTDCYELPAIWVLAIDPASSLSSATFIFLFFGKCYRSRPGPSHIYSEQAFFLELYSSPKFF